MRDSIPREQYRQEQEAQILANVKDLSDRWLEDPTDISRYLALQSRVSLKAKNTIQAYAVNPNALYVATYSEYENMGYAVLPGQAGIRIMDSHTRIYVRKHAGKPWQPLLHTNDMTRRLAEAGAMETREDTQVLIGTVFDITQTNCPPQDYGKMMGEPRHRATYEQIYTATVHFCEQFMPVTEKVMNGTQRGTYDPDTGCITINSQLPIDQKLSSLFHEMSHGLLAPTRASIRPVSRMEFEADALSILFSHRFGLPISDVRLQHMAASYLSWRAAIRDPDMIDQPDMMLERAVKLYQDHAEALDIFIQQQVQSPEIQPVPYTGISPEQENYRLLDLWVPEVLERHYRCLRMDADGLDPVIFRWVTPEVLSISHQAEYLLQINRRQETAQVVYLRLEEDGAAQTLSGHAALSKEYADRLNRDFAGWLTGIHRQHIYYSTQAQTLAGKSVSFEKPDIIWDKDLPSGERVQTAAAQTAAAIRKRLREEFPEVRFAVTSKTYAGGDSVTVKWTDGPVPAIVDNVIKEYQAGSFDGYTDSYNYKSIDPKLNCPGVHYAFTSRTISPERASELAAFAHKYWGDSLSETQYADHWGTNGVNVRKVESSFPETWSQQNQERWAAIQKQQVKAEPTQRETHTAEREKAEQNRQDAMEWSHRHGEIGRTEPSNVIPIKPVPEPAAPISDSQRETVVVNMFGGPGAGKTTCAWEIAAQLKKKGYVAEYVSEYAKELVWEGRTEQLDGTPQNQQMVYAEQKRRVDRLIGKVDFVVTDSPTLLNPVYLAEPDAAYEARVLEDFNRNNNFCVFIERDNSRFETAGRIHDAQQSRALDESIKSMLERNNVYYGTYRHDSIDQLIRNMETTYRRLNPEAETAPAVGTYPLTDHYRTEAAELIKKAVPDIDPVLASACGDYATFRALKEAGLPADPKLQKTLLELTRTMSPEEAKLAITRSCNCGDYLVQQHAANLQLLQQAQSVQDPDSRLPAPSNQLEPLTPEP